MELSEANGRSGRVAGQGRVSCEDCVKNGRREKRRNKAMKLEERKNKVNGKMKCKYKVRGKLEGSLKE